MKIAEKTTVTLNYILKAKDGTVLETTSEQGPVTILFGHEMFPKAVEAALEGKSAGDSVTIELEAKDGFGEVIDEYIAQVPISEFDQPENLEVGIDIIASDGEKEMIVTVKAIDDDMVTIDANHPFAGMDITFEMGVMEVRETTEEDLAHFYHDHDHECGCGCGHEGDDDCGDGCGDEGCCGSCG